MFPQMSSKQLGGATEDLRGGSKGKWEEEEEASSSSSFSKSKTSTTSSSSKPGRWVDEDASSVCSDNYQSVHLALPAQKPSKTRDIEEDDTESEDTLNLMKVHLKCFLAPLLSPLCPTYIPYDRKQKRRKPKLEHVSTYARKLPKGQRLENFNFWS